MGFAVHRPLRVLALTHCDITESCTFVRLVTPLRALQARGRIEYQIVSLFPRRIAVFQHILRTLTSWDAIWIQRPYHYIMLPILREARRLSKPVLVDLDDWLPGLHAGHSDAMLTTRPSRETTRTVLRAAHAITVSTPVIAERCAALGLRAHVLPNAINCDQFSRHSYSGGTITIAFCGSLSHRDDVPLITPALRQLLHDKPGHVRVVSVGCPIDGLKGMQGYTHHAFVPATEYPQLLSNLQIDIGLAPLHDTPFNQAKSDIKYLEYSAVGAATIASPIAPYQASIRADRGTLVSENTSEAWAAAIQHAVTEVRLRQNLATNAYEWVRRERSIEPTANKWFEIFHDYVDGSMMNSFPGPGANLFDPGRFGCVMASIVLRQLPYDFQQLGYMAAQKTW